MTAPTPTTPPAGPTQRRPDPILPVLGITFAAIAIVFGIIGAAASGALAVAWLFGIGALVMAFIEIVRAPRGLSVAALLTAVLALIVATGASAAVIVASANHRYAPPDNLAAASTPSYAAPYVVPTTAYTPPPTYTPAPVYVAPTTTTETTTTEYTPPPPPKPETWTYRVTGPPVVSSVTYAAGGSGNTAQDNNYRTPWHRTVQKDDDGYGDGFAYVSAQNAGGGSISCSITDDATGLVISQNTSNGEYAIVTCSS